MHLKGQRSNYIVSLVEAIKAHSHRARLRPSVARRRL